MKCQFKKSINSVKIKKLKVVMLSMAKKKLLRISITTDEMKQFYIIILLNENKV